MSNALTPPSDSQIIMNDDEASVFKTLMNTKESANVIIPDDISADDLLKYLSITAKAINRAQDAMTRLKPFLGRILLVAKQRKLYTDLGYVSYDDWMTRGVRDLYGVTRSDAFACVRIAEVLGFLPTEKVEALGFSKLSVVATAIRRSTSEDMPVDMREARQNEWVALAQEHTVRDLKDLIVANGYAEKGELDGKVVLSVPVNPETKARWEALVADPFVQEHCGTKDEGQIFDLAIAEVEGEWKAQVADTLRG